MSEGCKKKIYNPLCKWGCACFFTGFEEKEKKKLYFCYINVKKKKRESEGVVIGFGFGMSEVFFLFCSLYSLTVPKTVFLVTDVGSKTISLLL